MSLRLRIVLVFTLLMSLAFAGIMHFIMEDVRPRYLEAVEEATVDFAEFMAALLAKQATSEQELPGIIAEAMQTLKKRKLVAKIYDHKKDKVDFHVYITNREGILLYDSTARHMPGEDYSLWRDVYLTLRGRYGARSTPMWQDKSAPRIMYVAAPIIREGVLLGVVSVGKPTDNISIFINLARKRFFMTLLLVGASAIGLAVGLSFWVTRPVERLICYMQSIRQGRPQPLPALGTPEMNALGAALDEMQTKLEGKNYVEDYVRALTHEMKSPLTGIKGAAEILREQVSQDQGIKFLDNIESEVGRLQSLVERMLQLSRLENVRTIIKKSIPAERLFNEMAETFRGRLEKQGLHLELDVQENLVLNGDELLLRQVFGNLLANAIDFSPFGGSIRLRAETLEHTVRIVLEDQGTGIPDFALTKVFDKFFSLNRPGTGKKSTGLGLPFVKEAVTLHGGNVSLQNREGGLEVCITLPTNET